MSDEIINTLNQVTGIIDEKASHYKNRRTTMTKAQAITEKQLILELIEQGLGLAAKVSPKPADLIHDLTRLQKEFQRM